MKEAQYPYCVFSGTLLSTLFNYVELALFKHMEM